MSGRTLPPFDSAADRVRGRRLIAASFGLLVVGAISQLDAWVLSNDSLNDLQHTYALDPDDPFLRAIHGQARALCAGYATCEQDLDLVFATRTRFSYPMIFLAGTWLRDASDAMPPLAAVIRASVIGSLAVVAIGGVLYLLCLLSLPRAARVPVGAAALATVLVLWFPGRLPIPMPELVRSHFYFWPGHNLLVLALGLAGLALLARWLRAPGSAALRARFVPRRDGAGALDTSLQALAAAVALLALRVLLPDQPLLMGALQILALGFWAYLMARLCVELELSLTTGLALATLAFSVVNLQSYFWPTVSGAPLAGVGIAATGVVALGTRRRGALAWLLPLTLLCHVAVAGLFAAALFVAEACVCVRRRRVSALLCAAALTAGIAQVLGAALFVGVSESVGGTSWLAVLLTHWPRLLPGLLTVGPLLAIAAWLLRPADGHFDGSARVAILGAVLAAWDRIGGALREAGYSQFDADLHLFIVLQTYLALSYGFGTLLCLTAELAERADALGGAGRRARGWLVVASVLALLAARGETPYHDRARLASLARGFGHVFAPGRSEPSDPDLARIHFDDDVYALRSAGQPHSNDPFTYAALLQYALRREKGLFDPTAAQIVILPDPDPGEEGR